MNPSLGPDWMVFPSPILRTLDISYTVPVIKTCNICFVISPKLLLNNLTCCPSVVRDYRRPASLGVPEQSLERGWTSEPCQ